VKLTSTAVRWRRPSYSVSALMLLRRMWRGSPLTWALRWLLAAALGAWVGSPGQKPPLCIVVAGPATVGLMP